MQQTLAVYVSHLANHILEVLHFSVVAHYKCMA